MSTHAVVATVLLTIMAPGAGGQAVDWTTIKPQTTTQAELTARFGSPDEVLATFPWSEWSAVWKKRPVSSYYVLRYTRQSSRSPLLQGPAGNADSVEVTIADKKVISVQWNYGGPSARAAAAAVRADNQMNQGLTESMFQSAKDVPGGWLVVELGPNDSTVRVMFQMK